MEQKESQEPKEQRRRPVNNGGGKKPKKASIMYIVYAVIICVLGGFLIGGGNSKGEKEIRWSKLEPILQRHDYEKIVVVDQKYAEIYIKKEAMERDREIYTDLYGETFSGKKAPLPGHYKYDFVNIDQFMKDLERVEAKTGERIDLIPRETNNAWHEILIWFGPMLFFILLIVLMNVWARRQGGGGAGGGIFGVGKSPAKQYDQKNPINVTFKDVAGLTGAKEEVMEVVDFLKNPKRYTDLGGKIPKGVLLVGPPGTGKTLLAKAVAGEANVPFLSLSGSDFVEMFVGVGASRVRDLFEEAKKKSPCIIFIDEIDAVGRARGHAGLSNANDERENTLNQLLTEMDGFGSGTNVIVMAATNRADVLDKALLRAGRFDRQIYVDLPDLKERVAIFDVHSKKLKVKRDGSDEAVDFDLLSKQTPGFSGADIANVCNEAALCAARKKKKEVEKQDFLDAIDRIIGGIEKRTKVFSAEEKRTVSYHESGHASVSWLLRWANPLVKVTIVPRGRALGAAWYQPEERQITTYEQMFDELTSLMAGRAAEEVIIGRISTGALNDMERATKMAQTMVVYYGMSPKIGNISYYDASGATDWNFTKPFSEKTAEMIDQEVRRIVEEAYATARQIIIDHRDQMDQLAQQLYEKEVLFRDDLEKIYGPRLADQLAAEEAKKLGQGEAKETPAHEEGGKEA